MKKALSDTLKQLLGLNTLLWVQVVGMAVSISLGVTIFSSFQSGGSTLELAFLLLTELFIVLFSITTFSIYLAKMAARRTDTLVLRKTLGTSSWNLFLETSAQTSMLVILSIVLSIGVADVTMLIAGLNFEVILQSIGVLHYGALLLTVFIVSEGILFIVQGVALAPNARSEFEATTLYEKQWFLQLTKILYKLSVLFGVLSIVAFLLLYITCSMPFKVIIIESIFYLALAVWWIINRNERKANQW